MDFASWKDRKSLAQALRTVYRAADATAGQAALDALAQGPWGVKYSAIAQSWRRNWELVIPFFAFPEGVRRIIYTTNAIEALNSRLRRAVRTRGHFPSDDAATKLLYLVLHHVTAVHRRKEMRVRNVIRVRPGTIALLRLGVYPRRIRQRRRHIDHAGTLVDRRGLQRRNLMLGSPPYGTLVGHLSSALHAPTSLPGVRSNSRLHLSRAPP